MRQALLKLPMIGIVALCLAMMNYGLPRMAVADGGNAGTTEEVMDYSQREAQAAGLEDFEGGNAIGILIGIGVLGVLVGFYFWLRYCASNMNIMGGLKWR